MIHGVIGGEPQLQSLARIAKSPCAIQRRVEAGGEYTWDGGYARIAIFNTWRKLFKCQQVEIGIAGGFDWQARGLGANLGDGASAVNIDLRAAEQSRERSA